MSQYFDIFIRFVDKIVFSSIDSLIRIIALCPDMNLSKSWLVQFRNFNWSQTCVKKCWGKMCFVGWVFWNGVQNVPIQGLEPWYPAWKASMLTTYIISDLSGLERRVRVYDCCCNCCWYYCLCINITHWHPFLLITLIHAKHLPD